MNVDTWTSRKFVMAVGVVLLGVLFVVLGKADYNQWVELVKWIVLPYLGLNVVDQAVQQLKK